MSFPKVHAQLYFERICRSCRRTVEVLVHDYGELTLESLDEKVGMHDFPVFPIECPSCGREDWPEHALLYDAAAGKAVFRLRIGSADLPVVGGDAPYAVVLTPEEQAEYERGLAKLPEHFREKEEEFWRAYCSWALSCWREALKEVSLPEWVEGYRVLGLSLSGQSSTAAYRQDAEARFRTDAEKSAAWRALNRRLVTDEFLWTPPEHWPIERWLSAYGRERVVWLLLNLPLPEELERWRTEKLALAVPRKASGPQAVLWKRIGQLGRELDRQRKRSADLSAEVFRLKREVARLESELARAREEARKLARELEALSAAQSRPADAAKFRRYKALIAELRDEVKRLRSLLPHEEAAEEASQLEVREEQPPAGPREPDPQEVLAGKTVVVFGFQREEQGGPVRVVWHPGEKWDARAESLALEADVFVVLTRFCSHEVMWSAKEAAADRGVPVAFCRGSGIESVLREAAAVWLREGKVE